MINFNKTAISKVVEFGKYDAQAIAKSQEVKDASDNASKTAQWFVDQGYDYNAFYSPLVNKKGEKPRGILTPEQHRELRIEIACGHIKDKDQQAHLRMDDKTAEETLTMAQFKERKSNVNKSSSWIARLGDAVKKQYRLTLPEDEQETLKAQDKKKDVRDKVVSFGKWMQKHATENQYKEMAKHIQAISLIVK